MRHAGITGWFFRTRTGNSDHIALREFAWCIRGLCGTEAHWHTGEERRRGWPRPTRRLPLCKSCLIRARAIAKSIDENST